MKTLIAVPCMDQVPVPFCKSLAMLQKVGDCALAMKAGALIYASRDDLAVQAAQMEADFVMWFDSDMNFAPDTMLRLFKTLKDNNLDIVSGLYFRRVVPYTPVLFDQLDMEGEKCTWTEFKEVPETLFEVGGVGFGCILMKTDVFFDVQGKFGKMFTPIGGLGEDLAFCWRARQCGYKIMVDPNVVCGHVGYYVFDDKFSQAFRGFQK